MTNAEKIAFCQKRISEQDDYIQGTSLRTDISEERKLELTSCAEGVKARFVAGLKALNLKANIEKDINNLSSEARFSRMAEKNPSMHVLADAFGLQKDF